jgi:hypothetical protein
MPKFRSWSQEEIQAIMPLINSTESVNEENTAEFRKKYNRTLQALMNYVYVRRREMSGKRKIKRKGSSYYMRKKLFKQEASASTVADVPVTNVASEVKIPIKNMTITQDGTGLCLVVKF